MLPKIVDRNSLYCMKNFAIEVNMKKQTVIQIKETILSLSTNISCISLVSSATIYHITLIHLLKQFIPLYSVNVITLNILFAGNIY